jgi:hypothetical protein
LLTPTLSEAVAEIVVVALTVAPEVGEEILHEGAVVSLEPPVVVQIGEEQIYSLAEVFARTKNH